MKKLNLENPTVSKVVTGVGLAFTVIGSVTKFLGEQKKAKEDKQFKNDFKAMQEELAKLKGE